MRKEKSREDIIRNRLSFNVQTGTYCDSDGSTAILTVELLIDNKVEGHLFIDVPLNCNIGIGNVSLSLSINCIFSLMMWLDADEKDLHNILLQNSSLLGVVKDWVNSCEESS